MNKPWFTPREKPIKNTHWLGSSASILPDLIEAERVNNEEVFVVAFIEPQVTEENEVPVKKGWWK